MLYTFAATFSGVIASFLLWFGAQWWIRHRSEKHRLKNMLREIVEEINENIIVLTAIVCSFGQMSKKQEVGMYVPRLKLSAYEYAISNGDMRLLKDTSTQELIRRVEWRCLAFNQFVDNTELILAIGLIMPNGLHLAIIRLNQLIEQAVDDKGALEKALAELKQ